MVTSVVTWEVVIGIADRAATRGNVLVGEWFVSGGWSDKLFGFPDGAVGGACGVARGVFLGCDVARFVGGSEFRKPGGEEV